MKKLFLILLLSVSFLTSFSQLYIGGDGKVHSAITGGAVANSNEVTFVSDTTSFKHGFAKLGSVLYYYDSFWKALPTFGYVRDVVSDSVRGKVNKWERWADTLFIQKFDSTKVPLTIQVDTNYINNPTIRVIDSINRVLFEMRALPIKFGSENMMFGVGTGRKIRPIFFDSPIYGRSMGGGGNVGLGPHVLENLIDGNENTAVGIYALQNLIGANGEDPNLNGSLSTAVGSWAGRGLTTGIANVFLGQKAGNSTTTGGYSVMAGKSVGEGNVTGGWHVLLGSETGKFMASSAVFNTWLGQGAGKNNTGSYSILLGAGAGSRYQTNNELVAGDSTLTAINDLWFGKGKFSATPTAYTIHGTRGWGTDKTGGTINIAAGEGTGFAGFSGRINFQVSKPAGGGTQQHYLMNAMIVASNPIGNGGNVGINKEPTNTLDVINTQTNRQATDTLASFSTLGASYMTFGTTMRNITLHADARATNASGTGSLRNVGLYATASRGDLNYAAILDSGNVGIGILDPTFKLDVNGVSNFRSRIIGTSLALNKDSLPFATAASKLVLIDTVTGLQTKANIGTGLSLNSGTLSATTSVFGGSISATVTAVTTFIPTIPTQANNTYQVVITPSNALTAVNYYVTNKTTTSFDVVFTSPLTGTVAFDWVLKP